MTQWIGLYCDEEEVGEVLVQLRRLKTRIPSLDWDSFEVAESYQTPWERLSEVERTAVVNYFTDVARCRNKPTTVEELWNGLDDMDRKHYLYIIT